MVLLNIRTCEFHIYYEVMAFHKRLTILSGKPSKPLNLKALSVWKDYAIIGWDEPSDDGGCSVTGFTIEQRDAREDTGFVFVATVDGSALQYQVTFAGYTVFNSNYNNDDNNMVFGYIVGSLLC